MINTYKTRENSEKVCVYVYESLELTTEFLEGLIEELKESVNEEWEWLVTKVAMYMHLIEEKSSLVITKESMSRFSEYLTMHAGLKVVKGQY